VTYAGLLALISAYAPQDPASDFTSKHLQDILTATAPHAGECRKFLLRAEPQNRHHYATSKPDIAITYPWGMDLRRDLPRYLRQLYWRLRWRGRVASWEEFVGKTFWIDILFNDQNSKDIVLDLNAAQKIYEEAWLHAVFVMLDPLSRGWCLFEIGVRVWAVAKEFGLEHAATLRLLLATHAAAEEYTSRSDWATHTAEAVATRLPLFVAMDGLTKMEAEVFRYVEFDAFSGMATSLEADKAEIQKRLALLLESAERFNAVIAALATREQDHYKGGKNPIHAPPHFLQIPCFLHSIPIPFQRLE
jgi:hypothetical protein